MFAPFDDPTVNMYPYQGPPDQRGLPDPRSDIDPMQGPTDAALDDTAQPIAKQPGNRLSIKDYLKKIRAMQAAGQNVVPTFTNIQGGQMDVVQGQDPRTGENVRSYVFPEYTAGETELDPYTRGPAHPISRAEASMGLTGVEEPVSRFDPQWADKKAAQMLPEIQQALEQRQAATGQQYTQQDFVDVANNVRAEMHRVQTEEIMDTIKKFDKYTPVSVMNAFKTGNVAELQKAKDDFTSPENIAKVVQELQKDYMPEDALQKAKEYVDMMQEMIEYTGRKSQTQMAQSPGAQAQAANKQAAPGGGDREVVRTGTTKDGRKVVQYKDGTIAYAD